MRQFLVPVETQRSRGTLEHSRLVLDRPALSKRPTDGNNRKRVEELKHKRWAFPLIVIGANSIAAYVIAHLFERFIHTNLTIHLGPGVFRIFGDAYEPLLHGLATLLVMWLLLLWMYRRKLFLKI